MTENLFPKNPRPPEATPILGKREDTEPAPPVTDWREHYHTFEEMETAPPVRFIIDGFLPEESICGLAAPAGQRKSLIALNVAYACCTGEPLFGKFGLITKPTRVLYLCPEMGIRSFTDRVRKIGLMSAVKDGMLFCRTMGKPGTLDLPDLQDEEINGAVVILDTAIRYLKGDENSSQDMQKFAAQVFNLSERKAASVLVLHHSAKGTKQSDELTLENIMRGSGELGAFLTTCWATRLQNPNDEYGSASYLKNVKPRDYDGYKPFEVKGTEGTNDCRLHYVDSAGPVVLLKAASVPKPDEGAALTIMREHYKKNPRKTGQKPISLTELVQVLKDAGIKRGKSWVSEKRFQIMQEGGGTMP